MKKVFALLSVITVVTLTGCGSTPVYETADQQCTVRIGENVLADEKKKYIAAEYNVSSTMHRYITHRFRKLNVKKTLHFDVTLNEFRLKTGVFSGGSSVMKANVVVLDKGVRIKEFDVRTATGYKKDKAVKIMSKEIAIQMYEHAKEM